MCVLSVQSFYPVSEGSNDIKLGIDIIKPSAHYFNRGGIALLDITSCD